jgi:DNA-directed RNA polymerase specialized sigma24 family protein
METWVGSGAWSPLCVATAGSRRTLASLRTRRRGAMAREAIADAQRTRPLWQRGARGRQGAPSGSTIRMTTLDDRLYAWLAEPDDRRFERAFNSYFLVAFPAVVRHLARLSGWDKTQLEELAQDALLKFFERAGRRRREAANAIQAALAQIRPLNLGPFHVRQVDLWTGSVQSLRSMVMTFRLGPAAEQVPGQWKQEVRALTARIPPLQDQGDRLLQGVYVVLEWSRDAAAEQDGATILVQEILDKTARALAADGAHPGLTSFVEGTSSVVQSLPRLRVPTNGYLFEIALTLYLDECKRRGRQKRGGSGVGPTPGTLAADEPELSVAHPLDEIGFDPDMDIVTDEGETPIRRTVVNTESSGAFVAAAVDPTDSYEHEEFLQKFYDFLRKPLDDATQAYRQASTKAMATAQRTRCEAISAKFQRTVAVLSMMGEGYTQQSTAERLGLSRNQVKYIVELLQETYQRFSASSAQAVARHSTSGEL